MQVLHHLRSLNVRHFGMVAATALKIWRVCHFQWHELHIEFHNNLPVGSEVDREGGQTDTQTRK
jgi:hypothetical protein